MTSLRIARSTYGTALVLAAVAAVGTWWLVVTLADFRLILAIAGSVLLFQVCLRKPQAALMMLLLWLPFAGLVRRLFDYSDPVAIDALLAIGPTVTGAVALVAAWSHRNSLGSSVQRSIPTRLVALLIIVLALSIFNPIQGGVVVGLGGAVFLFFPVLWFFLGRAYFDERFVVQLYGLTSVVGVISALYGGYQSLVGLLPFDEQWIVSRQFSAMWVGGFIRPFSTFPNVEEWSRYLTVAATVAIGSLLSGSSRKLWWGLTALVCTGSLVLAGVRTSVLGYVLSLGVFCMLARGSRVTRVARVAALAGAVVAYAWLVPAPTRGETQGSQAAWQAFFGHTVRGLSAPLEEESLWVRTDTWQRLFTDVIPRYPLGMGLGVPSVGAWRFDAAAQVGTESYVFAVFVAAGVIGGGLLLAVLVVVLWQAWNICRVRGDRTSLITCAVLVNLISTSLVGNSLSLYTIGAMGWGLMGWVSAQQIPRSNR